MSRLIVILGIICAICGLLTAVGYTESKPAATASAVFAVH